MKNFIRKSFAVTVLLLPMLGQAAIDCGGGVINTVRENVAGAGMTAFQVDWSQTYPQRALWWNAVIVRNDKARSAAAAAFYSGSFVRFFAANGGSCPNIDEVVVCKSESTCSVPNIQ